MFILTNCHAFQFDFGTINRYTFLPLTEFLSTIHERHYALRRRRKVLTLAKWKRSVTQVSLFERWNGLE